MILNSCFDFKIKPYLIAEHFQNSRFVGSKLNVYWELPPVAGPSLMHQTPYDPARASDPIVEDGRYTLFQRLGLGKLDSLVFNGLYAWFMLKFHRLVDACFLVVGYSSFD
jgi:hypothetical protein